MTPSVVDKIELIRTDSRRGASAIAREALRTLHLAAAESPFGSREGLLEMIRTVGRTLMRLRPSMTVPVTSGILRLYKAILNECRPDETPENLLVFVRDSVELLCEESQMGAKAAATAAARIISSVETVMTHSISSTALDALKQAARRGVKVIVTESRPLCEGKRVAYELAAAGAEVTLITDAQAGHFMSRTGAVLTGADGVLPDGSVINKVGTYLLALAASDRDVPFFVVADMWKFGFEPAHALFEERPATDIVAEQPPFSVRNITFDRTPPHLISGYICEHGARDATAVADYIRPWRPVYDAFMK
jgi:translation initiation factor 2B subunit (eIF-2B alpha/beta/delta family)